MLIGLMVDESTFKQVDLEAGGSLFVHLLRYCQDLTLQLEEIRELLRAPWLKRTCFVLPAKSAPALQAALGLDEAQWRAAVLILEGLPREAAAAVIEPSLRYCPTCLRQGWHSALFQHRALRTCPTHGDELQTGCPGCRRPISTSPESITVHHHHCPRCGRPLWEQLGASTLGFDRRLTEVRAALKKPAGWLGIGKLAPVAGAIPSKAFHTVVASQLTWSEGPVPGVRYFPVRRLAAAGFGWHDRTTSFDRQIWEETTQVLRALRSRLEQELLYNLTAIAPEWVGQPMMPQAAYLVTLWLFDLPVDLAPEYMRWSHPIADLLPHCRKDAAPVVESHVLATFVHVLLSIAKHYRRGAPYRPTRSACSDIRLHVSWWIDQPTPGSSPEMLLRARVRWPLVLRLARRWARVHHRFDLPPDPGMSSLGH